MNKIIHLSLGVVLLAVAGCNSGNAPAPDTSGNAAVSPASTAPSGGAKLSIAVVPKGTTHVYWKSVEAGARKAGAELGVDIDWKGPLKESDRASQIGIVEQFVSEGKSAIVLAPLDETALAKPVKSAFDKKIPVVIIDSALKGTPGKDYVSLVATDNTAGGQLAGERLIKELGGKGKVVMLRYQEGSASTEEREAGFLAAIKKAPGVTVTVDNRYAGATMGEAKDAALTMVDKLQDADGIFCPNESSTAGMLLALRQSQLAGKKKFVGFDASDQLLDGLHKKEINALVVQNPTKMGYEGVKAAVAAIKHEAVKPTVDTGVAVVDLDNEKTPAIQDILGNTSK